MTRSAYERRKKRVRFSIKKKAKGRFRLSVFRSNKHIYAQVIDDSIGKTLAYASTLESEFFKKGDSTSNIEASLKVGHLVAKRSLEVGVEKVVFDKGAYLYHGRVKSVANGAREKGLDF